MHLAPALSHGERGTRWRTHAPGGVNGHVRALLLSPAARMRPGTRVSSAQRAYAIAEVDYAA
jgi:hypothetical protein